MLPKQLFTISLFVLPIFWFCILILSYTLNPNQEAWLINGLLDINSVVFLLLLAQIYIVCFVNLFKYKSISKVLLAISISSLIYVMLYSITRYMSHLGFDPRFPNSVGVGFATIISSLLGLVLPVVVFILYISTYRNYVKIK
jgi:hypothetical protein